MKDLKKVFLHLKPAKILVGLKRGKKPKYASILSKEADCTYSHTVKILNTLEEHGLIEFEKQGRRKIINLTEEGEDMAYDMESLLRKIERSNKEEDESSE